MEIMDILTYVAGGFLLLTLIAIFQNYWVLLLLIAAIINAFSFWASIVVFLVSLYIQIYDPVSKGIRADTTLYDSVASAIQITVGIVIAAWFIGMFFGGGDSGYMPCGRATPHGC